MIESLNAHLKRTGQPPAGGLSIGNLERAINNWYRDTAPATVMVIDEERERMRAHYSRVDPKPPHIKTENEKKFEQLLNTHGDDIEMVLLPDIDVETGVIFTTNQPLPKDSRKGMGNDTPINYLGIPPESRGKTKKERSYWIGNVYNANNNGRRFSTNLADVLMKYFNVSRMTIFNSAKYAAARDALGSDILTQEAARKTVAKKSFYFYNEGDTLKDTVASRYLIPWMTCDGLRSWGKWIYPGATDRANRQRDQQLRVRR